MSTENLSPENLPAEANTLARELAGAFGNMVAFYKKHYQLSAQEALTRAQEPAPAEYIERVLTQAPDQVSWLALENLGQVDSALPLRRWGEIKKAAREELSCGKRAGEAVVGSYATPWERARFLALRDEIWGGWQPRNGIERQLCDTLAQAQAGMLHWFTTLTDWSTLDSVSQKRAREEEGRWLPPRLGEAEAIERAAGMVDRFNRIFLRTLRALRDLRRYTPPVIVQNAQQVNVGGQQLNVADRGGP
jgi:hypothetical protein